MTYYLSFADFRRMFPRLSESEAGLLYGEITSPPVVQALEEIRSRCDCVVGAMYCMCGKSAAMTPVERATVEPLMRAWARGVERLPVGGS